MKLTKDVVEVLKYHGYMTFTESTETFLKTFTTVEELGNAGFIGDRGAIAFLETIFDENGVNRSAEVSEYDLEEQAATTPTDNSLGEDNDSNLVHVEDIEPDPEDQGTGKVEDPELDEVVDEQGPSDDVVVENPIEDKKEEELIDDSPTPEDLQELTEHLENTTIVNAEDLPEPDPEKVEEQLVEEEKPVNESTPETPTEEEQKVEEKPKPKKTTTKKTTKKES